MANLDLEIVPPLGVAGRNDLAVGRYIIGILHTLLTFLSPFEVVQDKTHQNQYKAKNRDKVIAHQAAAHGLYLFRDHG